MKVLVTGASGKLGAYIIRELRDNHELVLFSRRKPEAEFSDLLWVEGDINELANCQRAIDVSIEAIQHIAAQPWPVDHPELRDRAAEQGIPSDATFRSNMLGVYNLMQTAAEVGSVKTVVMAGSNCALGHGFRISGTPFTFTSLPVDESHPTYPEDSYSFTKRAGEDLLESYSQAYGIRTYVTRIAGICPEERRQQMAKDAKPTESWSDWLSCWVGSEDVASAHRLLMEKADILPIHDVYFVNGDDTTLLEPSMEIVERYRPDLLPLAQGMEGHQSFISCQKLKDATGWQHKTSWRNHL